MHTYAAGTAGPAESNALLNGGGKWRPI